MNYVAVQESRPDVYERKVDKNVSLNFIIN